MWKFQDFSASQILREINMGMLKRHAETTTLTILAAQTQSFEFVATFDNSKGRTFQELDKQTMSSANFQAENFLSGLVFDSSTFLLSLKIDQNSKFVYRTLEKCGL